MFELGLLVTVAGRSSLGDDRNRYRGSLRPDRVDVGIHFPTTARHLRHGTRRNHVSISRKRQFEDQHAVYSDMGLRHHSRDMGSVLRSLRPRSDDVYRNFDGVHAGRR